MAHFPSICYTSPLNPRVLFYDGHDSHSGDRVLRILWSHHIQPLILKSGDSMNDQPSNISPKLKPNNLYGNSRMNWISEHVTIKFIPAYIRGRTDKKLTRTLVIRTFLNFKLADIFLKYGSLLLLKTDKKNW